MLRSLQQLAPLATAPMTAVVVSILILTRGLAAMDGVPVDQIDSPISVSVRSEDASGRTVSSCVVGTASSGTTGCAGDRTTSALNPGERRTTRTTFTNRSRSTTVLLALVPGGSCATVAVRPRATGVPDVCSRMTLSVADDHAVVASGTMRALSTRGAVRLAALRPGSAVTVTLAVRLDPDVDDSYQGLSAQFPMRWSIGQT